MKKTILTFCMIVLMCAVITIPVSATTSTWYNPTMTSYTAPYGIVNASTYTDASAYYPYRAFDHVVCDVNSWTALARTGWLQYHFQISNKTADEFVVVTMYNITQPNNGDSLARSPKAWTLRASNTGEFAGEEVVLDTQSGQTGWVACVRRSFPISNTYGYIYYRLNITDSNDPDYLVSVGELALIGYAGSPPIPVANFTTNVISGNAPLTVEITDTSSNLPTAWNYTAYNTANSTVFVLSSSKNPAITFTNVGNYSVMLNASNTYGYNKTPLYSKWVNVSPTSPVAAFSATPTSGLIPLSVAFSDESANTPTSWNWSFGDENTTGNTEQNPVHLYTSAGTYNVNLTATNAYGERYEYKAGYITAYWPTAPMLSMFNTAGTAPFTTRLFDTSTNLTPGPSTYYTILGDGSTSTESAFYYTWNSTGTYTVCHRVNNSLSESWYNQTVTVGTPTPPVVAPVASFYGGPQTGGVPLKVYFTDVSSNTPTSWLWEFGDGTNSTSQNPDHTYTRSGFNNVALTVANSAGSNVTTRLKFVRVS